MNGSTVRRSRRTLRGAAGAVVTVLVLFTSLPPPVLADSPPDQTITFAAAPTGVVVGGSGFSVSASASSTLPVTYSSTTSGICLVDAATGALSLLAAGTCAIAADQAGDGTWSAAPQVTQSFAVAAAPAAQTITFAAAPTGVAVGGSGFSVSASASSGLAVTYSSTTSGICSVDAATGALSLLAAGTCAIAADQGGDTNWSAAPQVTQSFAVAAALNSQTITFGPLANKTLADSPVTIAATASSGLTVAFSSTTTSVCTVAGTLVTLLTVGTCTIDADQAGDSTWGPAPRVTQSFTVAPTLGSQAITFTSTAPSAAVVGGATYTVTATGGASGNPVIFTIDAVASAVCSISGAVVSFLAVGTCTINANQAGNASWNPAPQATQSFAVGPAIVPPPVLPTLTVTADPKSRPFGQANPVLTATISGFVSGQTLATSGVTGSPACATTATIASPAGTYPITCSIGTLASAAYTFAFAPGVLTVIRGASSVTLTTGTTVFETSTPATFTAAVEPSVTGVIPSGSLVFTIDGAARPAVPLDAFGRGSLTVSWATPGVKSVEVAFAGDEGVAEPGTAAAAPSVVVNTARATSVGVLGSTFYPIVDRWRDTVTARGIRNERLALAIEVRNAQGTVVRRYAAGPAAGAYAWAWNGKTSRGVLAPPGKYTIRQTLIDPYGSRPRRTVTSGVTVSLRKIRWTTTTIAVSRGPRCFQFSSGDGVGSYSCSSTAPLRLAGNTGGWPGVGYAFRLPAGGAYRSVRFEVLGTAAGRRPTIGFQDWTLGSAWGQLYRSGWARSAVSPTATRWAGVTKVDLGRVVAGRSVRVYVDGGGRLSGSFTFDLARARLVVSVGVFE